MVALSVVNLEAVSVAWLGDKLGAAFCKVLPERLKARARRLLALLNMLGKLFCRYIVALLDELKKIEELPIHVAP